MHRSVAGGGGICSGGLFNEACRAIVRLILTQGRSVLIVTMAGLANG